MTRMVVRWWPPYSNRHKDQPCQFDREAEMLCDWFISIGVHADIVRLTEVEHSSSDQAFLQALNSRRMTSENYR